MPQDKSQAHQKNCLCCGCPITNGDMFYYPDNAELRAAQAELMDAIVRDPRLSEIASRVADLKRDLDQRASKYHGALATAIPRFVPGRTVRLV